MKRMFRLLVLTCIYIIGAPRAFLASRRAHRPPDKPRLLLIRPDHLGDLVLTTPVLDALHTHVPDASLTMIVGPWSRAIVERHPALDSCISCDFPGFRRTAQGPLAPYTLLFQVARQLRQQHYDIAINLRPDFWWGAALVYLAAIPRRIGYALAPATPFLTDYEQFSSPNRPEHATVSNLRLISTALRLLHKQQLDEPYIPERYPLHFTPTSEENEWVTTRLNENGIDENTPFVIIHAGTGAAVKLWRDEAWATCANALAEKHRPTLHTILTGSFSERTMLTNIANGMHIHPLIVTDATVGQLAALMRRATLVLGTDTGPLHLAVAQGTPTLHIFGPTDPRIFGPWGPASRHVVIASTQCCPTCPTIPCGRLDIPPRELAAHPCTRLVSEYEVEAPALQLLDATAKIDYMKSQEPTI